jgi:CDP-diacylglycerol---glycerol-3-phosphate 3-phosphatidyltransferase
LKSSNETPTSLQDILRYRTRGLTTWFGTRGAKMGISPDAITVLGLGVVLISAVFAAQGQFLLAGIVFMLGTPLDALDGAIARAMNRQDRFGALLDSTLDRYADGFIFCGIAYYYASRGQLDIMLLAMVALIGAYCVSYVRARAEGLDVRSIKDGYFDRLVRTIILMIMLLTGWIVPGLVILAVGNHITAIQRIMIAYRLTRPS